MNAFMVLASTCAVALLASSCTDDGNSGLDVDGAAPSDARDEPGLDASRGDANRPPDAGGMAGCFPVVDGAPVVIEDPEQDDPAAPTFVWTGDGIAGVWRSASGEGYRVLELDPQGRTRVAVRTLWASERSQQSSVLAVSGEVLAIVDQAGEGPNQRQTCRFGLARLNGEEPLQAPTRFSDTPDEGTVLHEVMACAVAATDDGFLLVWQQIISNTSLEWSLFAQWVGQDGGVLGERLTIASSDSLKLRDSLSVTSDATRVAIVHPGSDGELVLSFVEGDAVRANPAPEVVDLHAAHEGFIARGSEQLWLLDHDGEISHGPVGVESGALVAPLESGYVTVIHDEFLVASAFDRELASRSAAVGISTNRSAAAHSLVYAPDGSSTSLLYRDEDKLLLAKLRCSDQPPPPPGPGACPEQTPLQPLEDGCSDPVCHVAIRLDYRTLGVLGWQVTGGPANPIDADGAREAARTVFDENGEYLSGDIEISGPQARLFTAFMSPSDFGAFALVSEDSGAVVAAGGIVHSGTGHYWLPSAWRPADQIACGDDPAAPELTHLDSRSCMGSDTEPPPTVDDALDLVLRSNLAAHVAAQGPFSAFAYLYTPTVGDCNPGAAEYLVVLSQTRQ